MNEINERKTLTEEYNTEFSYNENKSNLKISFERIAFIFFVFFIIAVIFSSKVILLSQEDRVFKKQISKKENFRSSIIDKDGNILAKSVPIINVGINIHNIILGGSFIASVAEDATASTTFAPEFAIVVVAVGIASIRSLNALIYYIKYFIIYLSIYILYFSFI